MQGGVRARVGVGSLGGLKGPGGWECRGAGSGQAGCEALEHFGLGQAEGRVRAAQHTRKSIPEPAKRHDRWDG